MHDAYYLYTLSNITYTLDGNMLKLKMIGTLDYSRNDRDITVYLKFYDKNGVVVDSELMWSDKLTTGESGYITKTIYMSSIEGAVSAKFVAYNPA